MGNAMFKHLDKVIHLSRFYCMLIKSKIKWAGLGVLALSFFSLLVHLFVANSSCELGHYSPLTSFNKDLNIGVGDRKHAIFRKLWGNLKSLESLQPYAKPRSTYPGFR